MKMKTLLFRRSRFLAGVWAESRFRKSSDSSPDLISDSPANIGCYPSLRRSLGRCPHSRNGFLLIESLLALLVMVLCSFLLLTSISAYSNCLKKGVNPRIEEREHDPKPQL